MDSLALNIFVPEERKPKLLKVQKSKKSPAQTVVRSSRKLGKNVKNLLGTNSNKPGFQKGLTQAKQAIKSHTGTGKPFLVSQNFEPSSKKDKKLPEEDPSEGFTVSFVKPKLFQKKHSSFEMDKVNPKRNKSEGITSNVDSNIQSSEKSEDFDKTVTHDESQQNDKRSGFSRSENVHSTSQKTVEFSKRTKPQRGKRRDVQKRGNSDVFVAQTFSKWTLNPAGTSDKVHVDFPAGSDSISTSDKLVSKRKFPENSNLDVKRRKKDFSKEIEAEKSGGNKKGGLPERKVISGVNRDGTASHEFNQHNEIRKSGPISSLFDGVDVEKLDELDVVPVEERLFSRKQFSDVGVHPHLVGNLEQLFGITKMTVVQKKTIPVLISGQDGLVRSQTGSGKTLAYALPIMHCLAGIKPQLTRKDGVKALVVLPTRELALQTYECFTKLMRAFTWIVPGK